MRKALDCSPDNGDEINKKNKINKNSTNLYIVAKNGKAMVSMRPTAKGYAFAHAIANRCVAEGRHNRRGSYLTTIASVAMLSGTALIMWFHGSSEALLAGRRREGRPESA